MQPNNGWMHCIVWKPAVSAVLLFPTPQQMLLPHSTARCHLSLYPKYTVVLRNLMLSSFRAITPRGYPSLHGAFYKSVLFLMTISTHTPPTVKRTNDANLIGVIF